ncbi:MAG: hypothetical protein H0T54_03565 [Geodermatophilaceae bacterium]|nr:hypothetical protein [Geodermatophilaceae bacterium]
MNPTIVTPEDADPAEDNTDHGDVGVAVRWLAWVIGLALLWYVLGFASGLARDNVAGAPLGSRLALPLYPFGYGRLFVGALVASAVVGLIGRRASRVVPATVLAAVLSWIVARAGLAAGPQARLYGNQYLLVFGTLLLVLATLLGLGLGLWGARATWRPLVALSVVAAVVSSYVLGVVADLQSAFTAQASVADTTSQFSRWLTLLVLFGLALAIAAVSKPAWLLLTALASVALPVLVTVLVYLSQLIRPGVVGNVRERILAPIADLVPAVLSTSVTWWPPLAVLAGGVVGLLVRQARRSRRPDMPVLDAATPVTTGDPGGRTPR